MSEVLPDTAVLLAVGKQEDWSRLVASLEPGVPQNASLYAVGGVPPLVGGVIPCAVSGSQVDGWNTVADLCPTADLILIDSSTVLSPGTLSQLIAVAAASPDAATVTTLGSSAGYLSTPARNVPQALPPAGMTVGDAADLVRAGSLSLHPRIPTALPHCCLVRRSALQLLGGFDAALEAREALADFCARATSVGMAHLLADQLYVAVRSHDVVSTEWRGQAGERYPALAAAVDEAATDRHSALSRALLAASVALEPLSVTIDARGLGHASGTVAHVLGLLGALAGREDLRVRAVLDEASSVEAREQVASVRRLEVIAASGVETAGRTHVAHRPWQIESIRDMEFLDLLGERTVVTNQDLIGYRTASVFPTIREWQEYRAVTRAGLGMAAMTLFFTQSAADDALADDLVDAPRARVVGLGVHAREGVASARPARIPDDERPFLLVLGARYRHKNVGFAMALTAALAERHGWSGRLIVAGHEVLHGSSSGDDAAWLLKNTAFAESAIELGAVGESEKRWLLEHAAAVVAPSTYEGFGLVPFEAAAHGTPCLVAPVSSFRSTLPASATPLVPWDPAASADAVIDLLVPGPSRAAMVEHVRQSAGQMTWVEVGGRLVAAYRDALRLPAPLGARLTSQMARAEHDYWTVREGLTEEQFALIRSDQPLLDDRLVADLHRAVTAPDRARRFVRALRVARGLGRMR